MLKEAGKVSHVTKRFVVVKANPNKLPKIGSQLVTRKLEIVGRVYDIIGPVKSPFLLIKPKKGLNLEKLADEMLFVKGEDNGRNRKGKRSRKERARKRSRKERN
ncbi:H/ACA ribonucleoprotein complex subunit GAR1 [Archaeoglobus sulfaticallidus]|uniref:H/ACA ribonucleoprotein complex subunit GAR1 n=1 Tax=Archaeoglobus sulfaticallidus TaxID=1316941 RepID=UPI0009DB2876|nr:H/ACA ribonucleoprotein complex subunit GAR1 [Archaeoglobus sulfaticallidus]